MLVGRQSWRFDKSPIIISSAAVGGPLKPKVRWLEILMYSMMTYGLDKIVSKKQKLSYCNTHVKSSEKAGLQPEDINFLLSGDLDNQITSSSFAARGLKIPYLGVFGACSTSMEGLAIASKLLDNDGANYVMAATASHNAAAEKQFRYPTEYGAQKPPTAQWTVTGAGAVILGRNGEGPRVVSATIGKVVDMGISDPFNMGAAMAPAAVDTIETHFNEREFRTEC